MHDGRRFGLSSAAHVPHVEYQLAVAVGRLQECLAAHNQQPGTREPVTNLRLFGTRRTQLNRQARPVLLWQSVFNPLQAPKRKQTNRRCCDTESDLSASEA